MKTQMLSFLFAVITATVFGFSNPTFKLENTKLLVVQTAEWKSEKITIQIKEESGVTILEEVVKNAKDSRKYNLKNLPDGNYSIEVSNELRINTQKFAIKNSKIELNSTETSYKPVIMWSKNHLDINLMTLGNKALINIVDVNNNIVFSENLNTPAVHKRYDTSALVEGEYSVIVAMNGRSFSQNFTK